MTAETMALLIVDDDAPLRGRLARVMERRGFTVYDAVGQDGVAPPLVHKIYEPSHHGDESFQRAVAIGVRAHHWKFGTMPAIEGLTRADVKVITAYVRELQRHNGIN